MKTYCKLGDPKLAAGAEALAVEALKKLDRVMRMRGPAMELLPSPEWFLLHDVRVAIEPVARVWTPARCRRTRKKGSRK